MLKEISVEKAFNPVAEPELARLRAFRIPGVVNQSEHLLRTGRRHNYYIDVDPLLNDPIECGRVIDWFVDSLRCIQRQGPDERIDILAFLEKDPDAGGTIGVLRIAGSISVASLIPHIVVRLGKEIPSERIKVKSSRPFPLPIHETFRDYNVAVLTDHCTGGDEALEAVESVEYFGGRVRHLLSYSIITPEFDYAQFDRRGIRVHNFMSAPDNLYEIRGFGFDIEQDGGQGESFGTQ